MRKLRFICLKEIKRNLALLFQKELLWVWVCVKVWKPVIEYCCILDTFMAPKIFVLDKYFNHAQHISKKFNLQWNFFSALERFFKTFFCTYAVNQEEWRNFWLFYKLFQPLIFFKIQTLHILFKFFLSMINFLWSTKMRVISFKFINYFFWCVVYDMKNFQFNSFLIYFFKEEKLKRKKKILHFSPSNKEKRENFQPHQGIENKYFVMAAQKIFFFDHHHFFLWIKHRRKFMSCKIFFIHLKLTKNIYIEIVS